MNDNFLPSYCAHDNFAGMTLKDISQQTIIEKFNKIQNYVFYISVRFKMGLVK